MVNTVYSAFLYLVCIQISLLLPENESTTDIKVIQDTAKPALMKSETIGIKKKFEMDFYDNRGSHGNNFQDYSLFHTNNGDNNLLTLPNLVNYPNAENFDAYQDSDVQQANYLRGPNLYYPLKPDTGLSTDNFYRQYQGQEPDLNLRDYNTGFYKQNVFIDHKRPQSGFSNSGRLDQNEFLNTGRLDQNDFSNMGQPDVRAGQPSPGLYDQGQPVSNGYFNRRQQSEYYSRQPNQNNVLNDDRFKWYPNYVLWDQQQIKPNQNWLLNQDYNQYNNENGQLKGRSLQYGHESSNEQQMRYPSEYLINTVGPSKVPVPTLIQNDNSKPGDDNIVAILGQPVVLPEKTLSLDKIIFPDSTESASRKQCAQDCLATSEYDPVCGTDKVTYINPGKLICARNCGISTYVLHNGVCDGD